MTDPVGFPEQDDEQEVATAPIGWHPWMEIQFEAMPLDLAAALLTGISTAAEGLGYSAAFQEESGFGRVYFRPVDPLSP